MTIKNWVPRPVKKYVEALINGGDAQRDGWAEALKNAESSLKETETRIKHQPKTEHPTSLAILVTEKKHLNQFIKHIRANVAALTKLITDDRMREAYDYLKEELVDDMQWKGFAAAAWGADMDFGPFRERLKQTKEHSEKIARLAVDLAELLEKGFGIPWPSSFSDIAMLLSTTDNHEMNDHNLGMWASMRRHILGRRRVPNIDGSNQPTTPLEKGPIVVEFVSPQEPIVLTPEEEFRAATLYAWGVAPPLSALLRTLAKEASEFQPSEFGAIAAATTKRQHNPKTEYIRAFAHILHERGISVTPPVQKALAVTATVMLDDPDTVVSYDDVRKALEG